MQRPGFLFALLFTLAACSTPNPEARAPQTAYLFTYFTSNGEHGLHLMWSRDGYAWEKLGNETEPPKPAVYLKPTVGESKLLRDPCVIRGPDGVYHMVWTTAWEGVTIGHATTLDFINWSEQRAIPVMAGIEGARNCWAPEILYDEAQKNFLIFWSSTVEGRFPETAGTTENKYNHRIYCTTTTDFKTFAPARVFYDPGYSVIDATLFKFNNRWHLIAKDETVTPPKKHLRVSTGERVTGPFTLPPAPPFTRDGFWVEGPAAFFGRDGEVLVYYDAYRDKTYGASRTRDMVTWEEVTDKISLPTGVRVRAGTIIEVPMSLIDNLRASMSRQDG